MGAIFLLLAAAVGAIAGGTAVGLWLNADDALDASDWLQFGGTALGVVVTVLLTLGVEAYRRRQAEKDTLGQLHAATDRLREAANDVATRTKAPAENSETEVPVATLFQMIRAYRMFEYAANRAQPSDPLLWQAIEDVREYGQIAVKVLEEIRVPMFDTFGTAAYEDLARKAHYNGTVVELACMMLARSQGWSVS